MFELKNSIIVRHLFADNNLPKKKSSHRRYVFCALDDKNAVILDTLFKRVIGFLDVDCIEIAETWSCFAYENNRYRITMKCDEYNTTIPLAVAIMCYKKEFFTADEFHVHHVYNVCDYRIASLQCVKPYSTHPPVYTDSEEYIQMVLGELGYTVREVLDRFGL